MGRIKGANFDILHILKILVLSAHEGKKEIENKSKPNGLHFVC